MTRSALFQQARGPSAQELLAKGDVDGALDAITYETPNDVRDGVARAALVKADATVTFALVSEDDRSSMAPRRAWGTLVS